MATLQNSPHTFLDRVMAYASEKDLLAIPLRDALAKQLLQGSLQVLDALFPRRICTTEQIERVFAAVRLVLGYGLFHASAGNPATAWRLLHKEGVFQSSQRGTEILLPYFVKDPFRGERVLCELWATEHARPAVKLRVYALLVNGSASPERTLLRIMGRAEAAEAAYLFAQAQFALFSAHNVECLDAAGDPIGVVAEEITTHILLHRFLHAGSASFPAQVDMDANLRAYLAASAAGKSPWDFDDPEWQAQALPEIPDPEMRKRLCAARCPLPLLVMPVAPDDVITFRGLWSGTGFPQQNHLSRLEEALLESSLMPTFDFTNEHAWGPYLLACALNHHPLEYPETGGEKLSLLQSLRDEMPDWNRATTTIRATFGQGSRLERWLRETLIPEAQDMADQLRRFTRNHGQGRASDQLWETGLIWLLDMHADL